MGQNGPKNLQKKLKQSYLYKYYFVSSCKKSENFNKSMVKKLQKTLFLDRFGPVSGPFWPKSGSKNFLKKNLMLPYPKIYYFASSCKKSENFNQSTVRKSQKTLFLGQFGPILAQNGPKKIFRKKKSILSHFKIYYSLTSCKK